MQYDVEVDGGSGHCDRLYTTFAMAVFPREIYYMVALVQVKFIIATDAFNMCHHSNESLSTLIFEHSDYPSPSLQIFPKNTAHFERYMSDIIDKK